MCVLPTVLRRAPAGRPTLDRAPLHPRPPAPVRSGDATLEEFSVRSPLPALTAAAVGLVLAASAVLPASAAAQTISVPDDFVTTLSDTRATGHYEVVGTGLRIWTEGATSTDKVAEYVATDHALTAVGEPSLGFTNTAAVGLPASSSSSTSTPTGAPTESSSASRSPTGTTGG